MASENAENSHYRQSHCRLMHRPRESPLISMSLITSEKRVTGYIHAANSMGYLHSISVVGSERRSPHLHSGPKSKHPNFRILINFKNSFTVILSKKFAIKRIITDLNTPKKCHYTTLQIFSFQKLHRSKAQ